MKHVLNQVFLRLYGFNLGRRFRNSPDQACSDALLQMVLLLVVPFGLVLAGFSSSLQLTDHAVHERNIIFIMFVLFLVLPVIFWVGGQFGHYKNAPDAASVFRSAHERRKSMAAFAVVLILTGTAIALIDHSLRSHL